MKPMIREETWPIIDQFFREMPEAIGKLPTFQEALAESLRRGEQQGLQQGALRTLRQTLIRQLHRKFIHVPEGLVQRIEKCSNLDQLDRWLDQIISAQELADIERLFKA